MATHLRCPGLYPLSKNTSAHAIFGIDVETYADNQKFLCASIVGDGYSKTFMRRDDLKKELLTNQIFRGCFMCATNLMFDFFAIFPDIVDALNHAQIIERHGDLVFVKIYIPYKYDGKFYHPHQIAELGSTKNFYPITFIDSIAHLKTSVSNLGKIIGNAKIEHPSFFPNKPKNREQWNELIAYNLRDSEITYEFMSWLQKWYNKLGCNLKPTASSSAMDLYRRQFLAKGSFWKQPEKKIIDDTYPAYYGGRSEAFKRGLFLSENWGKINTYDVNSLYPYILKKATFPIPYEYRRVEKITSADIESGLGTGHFELIAPKDIDIPIIPVKTDKLRFPIGYIRGEYDFETIKEAIGHGYELVKATDGICYEHSFRPFKDYVDKLYKERMQLKAEGNSADIICKLLMNSLYGKYGYKYSNKEMLMGYDGAMDEYWNHDAEIEPIGSDETAFRVTKGDNAVIPPYVFPIFALRTTACARLHMIKQYRALGLNHLFYTDTDSIFTDRKITTSSELGEMKLEEQWEKLCIVKPKMYAGVLTDRMLNIIKLKGMMKITEDGAAKTDNDECTDFSDFMERMRTGEFTSVSHPFRKLRGALNGNHAMNGRYEVSKSMGLDDDKRVWEREHFTIETQDSTPVIRKLSDYNPPPRIVGGRFELPKQKLTFRIIHKPK